MKRQSFSLMRRVAELAIILTALIAQPAWADPIGSSVPGGSSTSPRPGCESADWHSSLCLGIGWKYYSVTDPVSGKPGYEGDNSDPDNIVVKGDTFATSGGTISGCAEVGGYYRLGFVYYRDLSGGGIEVDGSVQRGLYRVDSYVHYQGAGGYDDWATVKHRFDIAEANGVTRTTWNETGAFCYDQEWDNVTSETGFSSSSTVKVNSPDITGGKTVTTEKDGSATIKFSTDKDSVNVDFSHTIYHNPGTFAKKTDADTKDEGVVHTNWNIDGAYTVGSTKWGDLWPDQDTSTSTGTSKTVTISGLSSTPKTVCSTIHYDQKTANLTGSFVAGSAADGTSDHYNWSATYSGNGSSTVCVEVTRPNPPSGKPKNPDGDVNGKIMFAGETSSLIWDEVKATSIETRRLAEWQAIKFLVGSDKPHNAANFVVSPDTNQDPCTMYKARFGITDGNLCKTQDSGTWDTSASSSHSKNYSTSESVKVPDNIGDKYCNSFGYKLEYWYGIEGSNVTADNGWHRDRSYWYNYGAACRTIAKRPSTAFWNGSIRTKEGINTSLAQRHNSITFGDAPDSNRTLFGSWTEYLVAANKNLDSARTMASGAALSNGSTKMKLCEGAPWETNSALTISNFMVNSNFCALAPSGNIANSVLLTRLNAYLRDVADNPNITKTGDVASLYGGVTGNIVVVKNGDLEITNNIVINDIPSGYTLHNVPQAVIFVNNGDVKISSNVTRIDAWIIATGASKGVVRTCWNYNKDAAGNDAPGTTTSDAVGSAGNNCTKQLSLNGPIIARGLDLRRSFGADNTAKITQGWRTNGANEYSVRQSSAEIFNLRADTYLWAYAQAARYGSSYQEVYLNELAPRY